ncbi:MAG: hypothetical protein JWM00_801 [Candidatus Saccharibacteria bacterium]|nr:hypothetical protein [Candidatus Saccharibacteria bacterium]
MIQDNNDLQLHGYQDDIDASDTATDPVMDERDDDPVKAFGVPARKFKEELDKIDLDDEDSEDARERIEDLDEDPDQESLAT